MPSYVAKSDTSSKYKIMMMLLLMSFLIQFKLTKITFQLQNVDLKCQIGINRGFPSHDLLFHCNP